MTVAKNNIQRFAEVDVTKNEPLKRSSSVDQLGPKSILPSRLSAPASLTVPKDEDNTTGNKFNYHFEIFHA